MNGDDLRCLYSDAEEFIHSDEDDFDLIERDGIRRERIACSRGDDEVTRGCLVWFIILFRPER
jgi:hypothetical protein